MILRSLALFAFALPALAQFDAATVLGTVRDAKGGVIASAVVTLQNVNTGLTAKTMTDASGEFIFPTAKIGVYTASVPAPMPGVPNKLELHVRPRRR